MTLVTSIILTLNYYSPKLLFYWAQPRYFHFLYFLSFPSMFQLPKCNCRLASKELQLPFQFYYSCIFLGTQLLGSSLSWHVLRLLPLQTDTAVLCIELKIPGTLQTQTSFRFNNEKRLSLFLCFLHEFSSIFWGSQIKLLSWFQVHVKWVFPRILHRTTSR